MQVCMVTTSYPRYQGDFAGSFLSHICKELGKLDVKVTVVVPNDGQSKACERDSNVLVKRFSYFPKKYQKIAYGYGGIPANLRKKPWLIFFLPLFLCTFFANTLSIARTCDIIHVNWIPTGYMCTFIKLLLRKPLVLTVRGNDINLYQDMRRTFRFLSRIFFPHIDLITTVSNEFSNFLRKEAIVQPDRVFVVPNGVSDTQIETEQLQMHRRQHALSADGCKAIFVGSLTPLKGIRWLVQAWKLVIREYPKAKLLIVGDGDDRRYLEMMARKLNLVKNIIFYGYQQTQTIPYWLACADIFVLPSLFEGRPNALLEALQSQLPVVGTNIAGIRELVQDGVNGFLVPEKNPEALADKILKLLSSERLRKGMGKAGKESIRARGLTWENCADRYHGLYKHLLRA
jgi:glycosyltransferase involved in cell wall biosynthesis